MTKKIVIGVFAAMVVVMLTMPIAVVSATSSLSIGAVSYDNIVVKDEAFTISATVTASNVASTITVTVTLRDNKGAFSVTNAEKTLTFTSNTSQTAQWSITAVNPGTYTSPFTVTASSSDSGTATPVTSSTAITIKERPSLNLATSQGNTTMRAGETVRLNFTVTNLGTADAADAEGVNVTLILPSTDWAIVTGTQSYELGTIATGGASKSGYWVVNSSNPENITVRVTSTVPGGTIEKDYSLRAPGTKGDVDGNPGVTMIDAMYLAKHVVGLPGFETLQ